MNAKPRLAAVSLALLGACASSVRDWSDVGERALPFQDLWEAVADVAARHHMPIHPRLSDRGRGDFTSRWREVTPGFGQTSRLRVRAELRERAGPDGAVHWHLRVCVERQKVTDLQHSVNPREADWSADGQDKQLEQVITTQLRLRFGDALPGAEKEPK